MTDQTRSSVSLPGSLHEVDSVTDGDTERVPSELREHRVLDPDHHSFLVEHGPAAPPLRGGGVEDDVALRDVPDVALGGGGTDQALPGEHLGDALRGGPRRGQDLL